MIVISLIAGLIDTSLVYAQAGGMGAAKVGLNIQKINPNPAVTQRDVRCGCGDEPIILSWGPEESKGIITGGGKKENVLYIYGTHCADHINLFDTPSDEGSSLDRKFLETPPEFYFCSESNNTLVIFLGQIPASPPISHVTIYGGAGDDEIFSGHTVYDSESRFGPIDEPHPVTIPETIYGEEGNDTIDGGDGPDKIYGGPGNDRLFGNGGNNYIYGDDGNDCIQSRGGRDRIFGGDGNDQITLWQNSSYTNAGTTVRGGNGNDVIGFLPLNFVTACLETPAGTAPIIIHGDAGNDHIMQAYCNSLIYGDDGDDALWGFDHLDGGSGSNRTYGPGDSIEGFIPRSCY